MIPTHYIVLSLNIFETMDIKREEKLSFWFPQREREREREDVYGLGSEHFDYFQPKLTYVG